MLLIPFIYEKTFIKTAKITFDKLEKLDINDKKRIMPPKDIRVNERLLSRASKHYDTDNVTDFIRLMPPQSDYYFISTDIDEKGNYDIYRVPYPKTAVTKALDCLYSTVVTDLRNRKSSNNGRLLDLYKLGFKEDKNLMHLESTTINILEYPDFLKQFSFSEIEKEFPKEALEETLKLYNSYSNSKMVKELQKHLTAASNNESITKMWVNLNKSVKNKAVSKEVISPIYTKTTGNN